MFDSSNRFIVTDYQQKPTFSSFLPGIAGPKGVPAWVYYNNRGQGVCSFGAMDKDHGIMEFCPAHVAYQNNARTGFRTFLKVDGVFSEILSRRADMHIGTAEMMICRTEGPIAAEVSYCGLPEERVAGLIRRLKLTNVSRHPVELEVLDGMPAVVCYGVNQRSLKDMTQLSKAWMMAEFGPDRSTRFAVRFSMTDTTSVSRVDGVNFCVAMDDSGERLLPLVDPTLVFDWDTGLERPEGFLTAGNFREFCAREQVMQNQFPCCFVPAKRTLAPGESLELFSLYGQADSRAILEKLTASMDGVAWFTRHACRAVELGEALSEPVTCRTSDPVFDTYARQTYVDNLLRGGSPIFFRGNGRNVPFYLYSRKHGDPEREYNFFSVGGEYYAQGNGNFRDVNQNRRSDVLFAPELGDANIRMFYELIQSDGCNPLVIQPSTFRLEEGQRAEAATCLPGKCSGKTEALTERNDRADGEALPGGCREKAMALLSEEFTPGALAMAAEDWGLKDAEVDAFVAECVTRAVSDPNASFGEGYWCDHWTYNLDLIESYLAVYPDRKEELLTGRRDLRWYASQAAVLPREKRYSMTPEGLRQYESLDENRKQSPGSKWLLETSGQPAVSTLLEKLILLCAIKSSTLDACGMGVEMEGGKPGWYDALNGLPGLLGSSMAESCELSRMLGFTAEALGEMTGEVELYEAVAELLRQVSEAAEMADGSHLLRKRWDRMNRIREDYREVTSVYMPSERVALPCEEIRGLLTTLKTMVDEGICRAETYGGGVIPTYFYYEASESIPSGEGILPGSLRPVALPHFLEGPVRRLKTDMTPAEKAALAENVANSDLYDRKLRMYKVNASLADTTFQVGRCRAFVPGWLENASIWLHMEYKYLLELLKSGLYGRFFADLSTMAVPFLDPEVYGRSPLENVSFLSSSDNPDASVHGRGFVARLSGSTAEFLQMWQLMFFGERPFRMTGDGLSLQLTPALPARLVPEDGLITAAFLGHIPVTYCCGGRRDLIPGEYRVTGWTLSMADGTELQFAGACLPAEPALAVREGRVQAIRVTLES